MARSSQHLHIVPFPYEAEVFDAHLQKIEMVPGESGSDMLFTLDSFRSQSAPTPFDQDGRPYERLSGEYVPMQLRFTNIGGVRQTGIYEEFDSLPADHGARHVFSVMQSSQGSSDQFYWFTTGADQHGELSLLASGCVLETRPGPVSPVELVRRWAPVPSLRPGYVPYRPALYRRYGGDPITFRLGRRTYARRLFIGGIFQQHEERPAVHHVLNLCGLDNPWYPRSGVSSEDRCVLKGEMAAGMDAMELFEEAGWVAERLRAGHRVLVHCYAGVNRSSTVCCATLMFLEGISPEEALTRVRLHHPLAWPDPYHWFILRWLSQALELGPPRLPLAVAMPVTQEVAILREGTAIG
jgi:Dual specificity phosphatase, catalytic domain